MPVVQEPDALEFKDDDYENDDKKENKVEEKYIKAEDVSAIYNAPPPVIRERAPKKEEVHEKTEAEEQLEKDADLANNKLFNEMEKMSKKDEIKETKGADDWLNDPKI